MVSCRMTPADGLLPAGARAEAAAVLVFCRARTPAATACTAHRDRDGAGWGRGGAGYLKQQDVPMVIVSHDREFLDQLCTKIVHTEFGKSATYAGNYTQFTLSQESTLAHQWAAWEKQQKEIARQVPPSRSPLGRRAWLRRSPLGLRPNRHPSSQPPTGPELPFHLEQEPASPELLFQLFQLVQLDPFYRQQQSSYEEAVRGGCRDAEVFIRLEIEPIRQLWTLDNFINLCCLPEPLILEAVSTPGSGAGPGGRCGADAGARCQRFSARRS